MKMPIAEVSPEPAEGQPKNIAADPIELARELAKQFTRVFFFVRRATDCLRGS